MTGLYDWNPMPHRVSVKCPRCSSEAKFEFAEIVKIDRKQDVPFFKNSDVFDYYFVESSGSGRWHAAVYYHGLRTSSLAEITELPEGYRPEHWQHSQYLLRSHGYDIGTIVCHACDLRRKHELNWPEEAFFQIEHRHKILWAFDRETVSALIEFIGSCDRKPSGGKWRSFLRHVPGNFLVASARSDILKKLNSLLNSS